MIQSTEQKMCGYHTPHRLSYLAAHADATERLARGEAQTQCGICGFWFWPDEMGNAPTGTMFSRAECPFVYCADPASCTERCVNSSLPVEGARDGE